MCTCGHDFCDGSHTCFGYLGTCFNHPTYCCDCVKKMSDSNIKKMSDIKYILKDIKTWTRYIQKDYGGKDIACEIRELCNEIINKLN